MYTLQFRILAASYGWNETALLTAYRQGLDPQIITQMAIYNENIGLESFMQKAVKISQRLKACLPNENSFTSLTRCLSSSTRNPCSWTRTNSLARNLHNVYFVGGVGLLILIDALYSDKMHACRHSWVAANSGVSL